MTIRISGHCSFDCIDCNNYKFQLFHCEKVSSSLSNQQLKNIVHQVKYLHLQKLNIVGGDLLELENFNQIIDILINVNILKIYNVHCKQINFERIGYLLDKDENSIVRIILHLSSNENDIINWTRCLANYASRILWSFIVSSENELELCYSILEKDVSLEYEIKPYYTGNNGDFIREFVFLDKEDILEINPDKKEIFANQVVNKNYFGGIIIQPNGDIYDNLNFSKAGRIDDCLEDVIHGIIKSGKSWRMTRNNDICNSCLYKYICPPPSNLEIVMKSHIICQKPKSYSTVYIIFYFIYLIQIEFCQIIR